MSSIFLIDTSIFLNFINVPKCNQERQSVLKDFETYFKSVVPFYYLWLLSWKQVIISLKMVTVQYAEK